MKCPCVGETDEESAYWVDSIEADRRYTSFLSCPPPIIFMVQRSQNTQEGKKAIEQSFLWVDWQIKD